MGLFDSDELKYYRLFWYQVYCAAHGYLLHAPDGTRGVSEYLVTYKTKDMNVLMPCSGATEQRQVARELQQDPDVKNIKTMVIPMVSAAGLIDAIRKSARTDSQ